MTIVIVVFITLSLMGSVLWIMPSKRDKEKMSLRMEARQYQLTVQLMKVEIPDKWDKTTESIDSCAYRLNRIKEKKAIINTIRLLPKEVWKYDSVCDGWWSSQPLHLSVTAIESLQLIGKNIDSIEITSNSISCFWNEQGNKKDVLTLSSLLNELKETI
ncbi:hypothetical protein O1D97_01985 [Marinomonas sp. 15G1-11]|uniref:Uncharacterized protein n=1 Tax=Marinomonas phaeophyticola TaxID=3004091 RepID=A0ABT4JQK7_9GAMM|nr:hypothetical protein [Marinomonas sp. 15G1-11]MCZ2720446.1 hypothetical protein [Marinomonas sp. 15G1-11]